jgi:subtilisin family serine protease
LSKRIISLLVSVAVAVVLAAGTASGEDASSVGQIAEAPLASTEAGVTFVPDEVVVRTRGGEYQTRSVDAQSLGAVQQVAEEIERNDPSVEVAGPNYLYKPEFIPNDPRYDLPSTPEVEQAWLRTIKVPGAWNDSRGTGVRIGIVDTGWQVDHPDLINDAGIDKDFVEGDDEAQGYDYHGTSVAGIAAADTNNSLGVAGVGFNAKFVMAKACAYDNPTTPEVDVLCDSDNTSRAIRWLALEQGVKIINLSFGAIYPSGTTDEALQSAIQDAQNAGALVVASAGDKGVPTDNHFPSCFAGVLGVGAVAIDGTIASFSNTGPCVDLVAPGVDVHTTYDMNDKLGVRYAYVHGTSFAAPQVAGAAALIKARNPDFTADQITNRFQNRATDRGVPGRDDEYGYGLLNAKCSVNPAYDGC